MVPIDGSAPAWKALHEAIELARLTGGRICLVYVANEIAFLDVGDLQSTSVLDVAARMREAGTAVLAHGRSLVERAGVQVETRLIENFQSPLCDVVLAQCVEWQADLLVIGTHGRRGLSRLLLGSGAEQMLRRAEVPVLLVRSAPTPDDH